MKLRSRIPLRDASSHQHLLGGINREDRNDRPDILHFGLLTAMGYQGILPNLNILFSSKFGVFELDKTTKIPRSQVRFYGLLETIFQDKYKGNLINKTNDILIKGKSPKIIFSSKGQPIENIDIKSYDTFIFGGFSTGSFRDTYPNSVEVSLSQTSLDLWTAISLFYSKYLD